ncbi:MAG: O-antigen ligase family protein [Chloroflexota bacterium]|nr:O-antigen ligase family protein [Chloroflexota bacterium]
MTRALASGEVRARSSGVSVSHRGAPRRSAAAIGSHGRGQRGDLVVHPPLRGRARMLAHTLSLAFVFLLPMDDLLVVEVLGFRLGSIARTSGFLLLVAWVGAVIDERYVRYPDLFHWLAYAFFAWSILTFAWSRSLVWTISRTRTYLQVFLMLCVLWDLYRSTADLADALQAYVFGSYASMLCLFSGYVRQVVSSSAFDRLTAGEFNPNGLALFVTIGTPLAWHLTHPRVEREGSRPLLGIVNLLYVPLSLFAIALTGSRGALAASAPVFVFIFCGVATARQPRMIVRLLFILFLVVALYRLVPGVLIDRLWTLPGEIIGGDLGGRRLVWRHALSIFARHPLVGVGSGAFRVAVTALPAWQREKVAHNTFLSVLVETGVVGFGLFVACLARVVCALVRRRQDDFRVWLVVLFVWSVGVCNLTWEHRKVTWLVMLLALVSSQAADD